MKTSIPKIRQALLTYIEDMSLYEVSKFLQHSPKLVEAAIDFVENPRVSVYEDLQVKSKEDIEAVESLLQVVR